MPAFPGQPDCPAGERSFKNGSATVDVDVTLEVPDRPPVIADLDGAPGDEVLVRLNCSPSFGGAQQIFALGSTLPAGSSRSVLSCPPR